MYFRGIIGLSLLQSLLLAPAENKRTPSPPLHPLVDLLPEGPEIVDGRDDGNTHHEPDGHLRYQIDRQPEREEAEIESPDIPADGQNRRHHGDDLHHHLQLAQLTGLNGEAFRSGDGAQAGDQELPSDDQHHDPDVDNIRHQAKQGDIAGGDHQLVRQRVQQHAHGGDLAAPPRQIAVQPVSDRGQNKDAGGQHHTQGIVPRAEIWGSKDPYDQRDGGNPRQRDVIWQVHLLIGSELSAALIILGFRPRRKRILAYFLPLTVSRQRVYSSSRCLA